MSNFESKIYKRGFASMTKIKHRAVSSMGGAKTQLLGTGHKWNTKEAQAAQKKSLEARRAKNGNSSLTVK